MLFVENQLIEIHETVRKNMTDLMKRGETIEDLMKKSSDLSVSSKKFYGETKKQNKKSCFQIC